MLRRATPSDSAAVTTLALLLWPEHTPGELRQEFDELLVRGDAAVFLAEDDGVPVAFAQCQLRRDYVEGAAGSPVGYLEGIFVREAYRRQGVAKALLSACEEWSRTQGCAEFASDCALDNTDSFAFHKGVGFDEASRIICFIKRLDTPRKV